MKDIELSAGTIRYRDTGSGPAIAFVHGAPVEGALWRKFVPLLQDRYRCLVPDWPLGSHTLPMRPQADLTPPGLARAVCGGFFFRGMLRLRARRGVLPAAP